MSVLDTTDRILQAHFDQGAPRDVVESVREFRRAERAIADAQYLPERTAASKSKLRDETVEAARQQLADFEAAAATDAAGDLERHDARERDRITHANGHRQVDHERIAAASTVAELKLLVEEALAVGGADAARRTWEIVRPKMKAMMVSESRRHIMPSMNSAFTVYCTMDTQMSNLTTRAPDRTQVSDAGKRHQANLREQILSCWRTVGLDAEISRAAVKAAVGVPPSENRMTIGSWFDKFAKK